VPELRLRNFFPSRIRNTEVTMHKPRLTSAAALSASADSAMRENGERDEDNLDHEAPSKDGDGDIAGEVVTGLVRSLYDAGPAGVFLLRKFTFSLDKVGDAVMAKDHAAVEEAGDAATRGQGGGWQKEILMPPSIQSQSQKGPNILIQ
jgi:hypothetical protein